MESPLSECQYKWKLQAGLEPVTSCLASKLSTSWDTATYFYWASLIWTETSALSERVANRLLLMPKVILILRRCRTRTCEMLVLETSAVATVPNAYKSLKAQLLVEPVKSKFLQGSLYTPLSWNRSCNGCKAGERSRKTNVAGKFYWLNWFTNHHCFHIVISPIILY